jgi:hypothetical protein
MVSKQIDQVRCDDCGTQNEIWIPPTMGGDNLVWCCRSCGSELTRVTPQVEPSSLRTSVADHAADARVQRVH